jgi:hypothetical protein
MRYAKVLSDILFYDVLVITWLLIGYYEFMIFFDIIGYRASLSAGKLDKSLQINDL